MKRPTIDDTRTPIGHQSIGGNSVSVYTYSKLQDEYIDYLEQKLAKNCSIPDVVGRSEQLVCDCGKPYHERDLEHGMCHQCWEPTK